MWKVNPRWLGVHRGATAATPSNYCRSSPPTPLSTYILLSLPIATSPHPLFSERTDLPTPSQPVSASPHPLSSERTEPRGRGLPPGSVSRARRQLVGGECATCVRHGRGGGGLGALRGPVGLGARRGAGCLGGERAGLCLEGDVTARGKAAGGLAKRPRGGLWRMGGGRNTGGWALETLGGGVGELPRSPGLGILGIFPLGWRTTTPESWG